MIVSTAALLLVSALQTPAPPFELPLPEGYLPFQQDDPTSQSWVSRRADDLGMFKVERFTVTSPGANQDSTAAEVQAFWQRNLASMESSVQAWTGEWLERPAAGADIRYTREGKSIGVLERMLLIDTQLIHALWEGPEGQKPAARAALHALTVPNEWIPLPPPETDIYRGIGQHGAPAPFPGSLRLHVDLSGMDSQQVMVVDVIWDAPEGMTTDGWVLPPAAQEMKSAEPGPLAVRYRLRIDDNAGAGSPYGMTRPAIGHGLAALNANWVAVPNVLLEANAGYQPPAWTLRISYAANLQVFSFGEGQRVFDEETGLLQSTLPSFAAGSAWPYFLVSAVEPRKEAGVTWSLRKDAKATSPETPIRGLIRLDKVLRAWMPHAPARPHLTSYPGTGDRAMPGLLVLDENERWFDGPLDATRDGLTRRVWLARAVAAGTFGAGLRGVGTGAPILEGALSEYAAWRLLEEEWAEDAAALQASWVKREQEMGALPVPLSMMPPQDAFGARRLQSRGPLVWQAIERKAGRVKLDAVLDAKLAAGLPWTTRDLKAALDEATEEDWSRFFRDYVYGRLTPPTDD